MAVAGIRAVSAGADEGDLGTSTIVITKPTGTASGDRLVAIVAADETAGVFPTNADGFNIITSSTETGTTPKFRLFEKTAGGSEPASYTWSITGFCAQTVWLYALNTNQTNLVFGANFGSGTSTACLAPSVLAATHGGTDPLLLTAHVAVVDGTDRTISTPTGMTLQPAASAVLDSNWMNARGFSLSTLTGAVATGDRTATIGASEPWRSCSLAVAQAPATFKRGLLMPT